MRTTPTFRNTLRVTLGAAALALFVMALTGCGQKGDLYLPDGSSRYSQPSK